MATPNWLESLKQAASYRLKKATRPGFGRDVDLPLEKGQKRDPRLGGKPTDVLEQVNEAAQGFKGLKELVKKGKQGR